MPLEKISLTNAMPATAVGKKEQSTMPQRKVKRPNKKIFAIVAGVLLVLLVLGLAIFFPAQEVMASANKTYAQGKLALGAIKKQDIGLAKQELVKTQKDLADTQVKLGKLAWTQFIPLVGLYYGDAKHGMAAASAGLDAANTVVDAILPYADVLGLKGQGSFVLGSAEDRIQKAVATMDKVTPKIPQLEAQMEQVEKELAYIDPNRYPSKVGKTEIKSKIAQARQLANESHTALSEAKPLLEVLPQLLGEPKSRRYLVLFQNDKELRPSGGFMTAYAAFRIEHGVINLEGSDDIYALDNTLRTKTPAPDIILKNLPLVSYFNLRDSNISPDFYESMKLFEGLYNNAGGKVAIDGIIAVDTHVLVTVLNILGPIDASGIHYTTSNDPRCSCPQVIYELENYSSRPVNYVRTERKDNIGSLLYEIMKKALSSAPKQYWGPLFQAGLKEIGEKHVLFYMHDSGAQKGLESLNAAGRIRPYEGDYLHINDANFAGAKSNLFVQQAVTQTIQVDGNGVIKKTVKIEYTNPHPPSDCNLERGGLCLNGLLRDLVRVYVPKGSQLTNSTGSQRKVETREDLGKTYFESFIEVRPGGGKATLELTYTLPFKLAKGSPYLLLIQKQPGTDQNQYTVSINNRQEKFKLDTDKELKIKL